MYEGKDRQENVKFFKIYKSSILDVPSDTHCLLNPQQALAACVPAKAILATICGKICMYTKPFKGAKKTMRHA